MQLEKYLNDELSAYLVAERYINNGSPSKFSEVNTTSEETTPKSWNKEFDVFEIEFLEDVKVDNYGDISQYINLLKNSMIVHPDVINSKYLNNINFDIAKSIRVEPTSSGRTVVAIKEDFPFFIKMAYPYYLGRMTRHMGKNQILSAIEVSDRLSTAADQGKFSKCFAFFKESAGRVAYLGEESYQWGLIFREFSPYPYVNEKEFILPFFSLFGSEFDPLTGVTINEVSESILFQLFQHQSYTPEKFLLEKIIFPLCSVYFEALLFAGVELEAHAQNMLLTFGSDFQIRRIICRDLESAGRDITLMKRLELPYDYNNPYKCNFLQDIEDGQKYPKWYIMHSFMFDFKLGEYVLTPLLNHAKLCFPLINIVDIQKKIKEFNQQYTIQLPDFFPTDWCVYDNINFEKTGKKREYHWIDNPKYR